MLLELEINNLAVIETAQLTLVDGLNILTGETGAGKSILVDAIGLVLGDRANSDLIRAGAEQARVAALFRLPKDSPLRPRLLELGLEIGEEEELFLNRELASNGKNIVRINGRLATVGMLRSIGEQLVDIHGQHQHQSLLRPETHIAFLDSFGGKDGRELSQRFAQLYEEYRRSKAQLLQMQEDARQRAQKVDMYSYQVAEIEAAKLIPGEEEELETRRQVLKQAANLYEASSNVFAILYEGNPDGLAVMDLVGQASHLLRQAVGWDAGLKDFAVTIEELTYQIEEMAREIRNYRDDLDLKQTSLQEVEERLQGIGELKRKYGDSIDEILAYQKWAQWELENLENSAVRLKNLEEQTQLLKCELTVLGSKLSEMRRNNGQQLAKAVQNELGFLGMSKTGFVVHVETTTTVEGWGPTGFDTVEFCLAPNPGEPPKSLAKTASGGELSRVMLALKNVLTELDPVETLIFDEVDTGIGGRTAQAVAERLVFLAKGKQILCVTHLPQIASMADNHYLITKEIKKGQTFTELKRLADTEQVAELARMLGGSQVTKITCQHAQEMLEMAKNLKGTDKNSPD